MSRQAASPNTAAVLNDNLKNFNSLFLKMCQAEIPMTKKAATTYPDTVVWKNLSHPDGFVSTARKSAISAL